MGYKKTILEPNKSVGYYFDSLRDVEDFIGDVSKKIPVGSKAYKNSKDELVKSELERKVRLLINSQGEKYYGTTDSNFVNQPLQRYLRINEVEIEVNKLNQKIEKKDFVDIDQVKKLEFTEKDIGIFSFDLASLGLVRVYEYYSPLLKEIVNSNYVVSEKLPDGKLLFYYVGTPYVKRHEVEYVSSKGGYYSYVLNRLVDKSELLTEDSDDKISKLYYPERQEIKRHEVERRQVIDKNGKPKFATTYKKCFINIPKVKKEIPRIDIIVPLAYPSSKNSDVSFWNSVPLISICEKLTQSNVDYRVIGVKGIETVSGKKFDYAFINIKNEEQPLDKNQLSMVVSDMRFYRTTLFSLNQAMQYDSGFENYMNSQMGYPIRNSDLLIKEYMKFLSLQTNESDRAASENRLTKIDVPIAESESEAIRIYTDTIQRISRL